jgi:hypothetical protein
MTEHATSPELLQHQLGLLTSRLAVLEAERAVRNVLARYMLLCDQPCDDQAYPQLDDLFTDEAIWEGVGALYTETFGRQLGRTRITAFLATYLAPSTHFRMNVHFLTSDEICVAPTGDTAHGRWVMLQVSTYENGDSEMVSARLNIDFVKQDALWKMSHFRTQRLFDLPWKTATGGDAR